MHPPDFSFERRLIKKGFCTIAGVDEVGRGALAGPVVAACVVFPIKTIYKTSEEKIIIDDSKKLTSLQREKADIWIRKNALTWGIGQASVGFINKQGIVKAGCNAFRKAIKDANKRLENKNSVKIDYLLIDAFYIPFIKGLQRKQQQPIIHGDEISVSIAAASIIAKVFRDARMTQLGKKQRFNKYGWANNKGYGTAQHCRALTDFGKTGLHRTHFLKKII